MYGEPWTRPSGDPEVTEYWERLPGGRENHIWGVEAMTGDGEGFGGLWRVNIWAQEFFRQDRLGLELRRRIQEALGAVPGVVEVSEWDNESWCVEGSPSGQALSRAAALVVDELADRMQAVLWGGKEEYEY